jgi:hypothetical protein
MQPRNTAQASHSQLTSLPLVLQIGFLSVLKFLPTGPLTGCGIVEEPAPISEGNKVGIPFHVLKLMLSQVNCSASWLTTWCAVNSHARMQQMQGYVSTVVCTAGVLFCKGPSTVHWRNQHGRHRSQLLGHQLQGELIDCSAYGLYLSCTSRI